MLGGDGAQPRGAAERRDSAAALATASEAATSPTGSAAQSTSRSLVSVARSCAQRSRPRALVTPYSATEGGDLVVHLCPRLAMAAEDLQRRVGRDLLEAGRLHVQRKEFEVDAVLS